MNLKEFEQLVNIHYLNQYNTVMIGGFDEPLYLPGKELASAEIRYTRDYYRSALHELAHWCIAGTERRKLEDYGYWYVPDGRNQEQQNEFYNCEVKPQALEWAFSIACGIKFDVSVDNIGNDITGHQQFSNAVCSQLLAYLKEGFPHRVVQLLHLICEKRFGSSKKIHELLAEEISRFREK